MGAPKTKEIGGGANVGTSNDLNAMLQNQLGNGSITQPLNNLLNGGGAANAQNLGGLQQQGMTALPNAPAFQNTNFQNLNTNFNNGAYSPSAGFGLSAGMNVPGMSNVMGMQGPNLSGLQNFQANAGEGAGNLQNMMAGQQQYGVQNLQMPNADVNSPRAQAIAGIVGRQNQQALAQNHARYAAGGMGSMGSGAMLADAQTNAEGQNQLLAGLQNVTQQDIQNNLQYGQVNNANQLQAQGLGQSDILARLGLSNQQQLGNRQIGSQNSIANMQGNLQAQSQLGSLNSQNWQNQMNTGMQGSIASGNQALQGMGLNLQGMQQGATNQLNSANFNQAGMQQNNANQFGQNSQMNNFLQQMFGQQSQNALGNQSMGNQFALGGAGMQQQGMMGALQQLFGSMNGANQLGTAQRQTVQTPSDFAQVMQGLQGVAGLAGAFMNPMSGLASAAGTGAMSTMGGGYTGMNPNFGAGY